jgi:Cys-rich protein (TIGR01571 family)
MAATTYEPVPLSEEAHSAPTSTTVVDRNLENDRFGFHFDWLSNGGFAFDVLDCSPHCGSPWNFKDCLYCLACWTFCGTCSAGKLMASAAGHDQCSVVNHCLPWVAANLIDQLAYPFGSIMNMMMCASIRSNLRRQHEIGEPGFTVGDFAMHCVPCFAPCASLQEIRSVPVEAWDWLPQVREHGIRWMHPGSWQDAYIRSDAPAPSAAPAKTMDEEAAPAKTMDEEAAPAPVGAMPVMVPMQPMQYPMMMPMSPPMAPAPVFVPQTYAPNSAPAPQAGMPFPGYPAPASPQQPPVDNK